MKAPDITDIPIGRDSAISRSALCDLWGVCDRIARRNVQAMRMQMPEDGFVIVSSSQGEGYYRTDDFAEIRAYIDETERRAKHTFLPLRVARLALSNIGQVRMEL